MDIDTLNLTLADVEVQLLRRKCDMLESDLDELTPEDEVDEATLASDGAKIATQQAGGGMGGPETYAGYSVGREGDRHMDGGGTKTAAPERSAALAAAMRGGPGDMPPQTTAGKAAAALSYTRKDKDNQGDVDHSGHQSGAGGSGGGMAPKKEPSRMTY